MDVGSMIRGAMGGTAMGRDAGGAKTDGDAKASGGAREESSKGSKVSGGGGDALEGLGALEGGSKKRSKKRSGKGDGALGGGLEGIDNLGQRIRSAIMSMLDGLFSKLGIGGRAGAAEGVEQLGKGAPKGEPTQQAAQGSGQLSAPVAPVAPVGAAASVAAPALTGGGAAVPLKLTATATSQDKALVDDAYAGAMSTEEGRAVLTQVAALDVTVEVVDGFPNNPNQIGRFYGVPGEKGVIQLSRLQLQRSPEAAAALLAHEARHALPGGESEEIAEVTEQKVIQSLGGTYVKD